MILYVLSRKMAEELGKPLGSWCVESDIIDG